MTYFVVNVVKLWPTIPICSVAIANFLRFIYSKHFVWTNYVFISFVGGGGGTSMTMGSGFHPGMGKESRTLTLQKGKVAEMNVGQNCIS